MTLLQFGSAKAAPGEKAWGQLRVQEGKKRVRLPVCVVHGARPGEHVVALANQHGGEINGIEAIRRFAEDVDPRKLRGSVFLVPSANPRAALMANEFWDEGDEAYAGYGGGPILDSDFDRNTCPYNMNRVWPGEKGTGRLVDRTIYELWSRAVLAPHRRASLVVDIHGHQNPSTVYSKNTWDTALGVASGIPTIINTRSGGRAGTAGRTCWDAGIATITPELGKQFVLDAESIEIGRRALFNLLKFWGMLRGKPEYPEWTEIVDPGRDGPGGPSQVVCKAPRQGITFAYRGPYERVRKGERICHITDVFTGRVAEELRAPRGGVITRIFTHGHRPLHVCKRGDVLFSVSESRRVRTRKFVAKLDPETLRRNPSGEGAR